MRRVALVVWVAACGGQNRGSSEPPYVWEGATRHARTFSSSDDFAAGEFVGVNSDSAGELVMNAGLNLYETPFIWIPNSTARTVTRVDTRTLRAEGEFPLLGALGEDCWNPSRTTVDLAGNVWVGCRGTSSYINRDEIPAGGVPVQVDNKVVKIARDDGRVLLSLRVGHAPRAMALDANNHLWIGCSVDDTVWEIDGDTGQCYRGENPDCRAPAIAVDDFPYGIAVDQRGHAWVVHNRLAIGAPDLVTEIETASGAILGVYGPYLRGGCNDLYGVAIDQRNDVWLGGYHCNDVVKVKGVAGVYPLDGQTYAAGQMIGAYFVGGEATRGVAVDLDGNVWAALSGTDTATKISGASGSILTTLNVGADPIGVGVDAYGNAWVVNRGADSVHRINGLNTAAAVEVTVGEGPYTYSDMLGMALRTITHRGDGFSSWRARIDSELPDPEWLELHWTSFEPTQTRIEVRMRCAARESDLATAPWGAFINRPGPIDCAGRSGRWGEVEARFHSNGTTASPVLYDLTVYWN